MHAFHETSWVERRFMLRRKEWAAESLHSVIRRAYDMKCAEWNAARYVAKFDLDCQRNLSRQALIVWC